MYKLAHFETSLVSQAPSPPQKKKRVTENTDERLRPLDTPHGKQNNHNNTITYYNYLFIYFTI